MNVNIDELVSTVRQRVREQVERTASENSEDPAGRSSARSTNSFDRIQASLSRAEAKIGRIGAPTPEPPTIRGRIGAVAIRLLARLLWWYSHELGEAFAALIQLHREQRDALAGLQSSFESERQHNRKVGAAAAARQHEFETVLTASQAAPVRTDAMESERLRSWVRNQIEAAVDAERTARRGDAERAVAQHARTESRDAVEFERLRSWVREQIEAAVDAERTARRGDAESAVAQHARTESRLASIEAVLQEVEKTSAIFICQAEAAQVESERTLADVRQQIESQQCQCREIQIELRFETEERTSNIEAVSEKLRSDLKAILADEVARMDVAIEAGKLQTTTLEEHYGSVASDLCALGLLTHQNRATASLQDRRISFFIEEARKQLPDRLNPEQIKRLTEVDLHKYDAMYVAFEDVFRGSAAEITARQEAYLPLIEEHKIGSEAMPLLDLGCGRGEWLGLLRGRGLIARGVDRNEQMIGNCRAAGLEVTKSDALSHLRSLPDGTLGAVTSFHMVEHLPFEIVLAIVDECLRVLRPGGVFILETPNPQNLMVGAHTFYLDPTHLRPLPSPMLRFFVEARGFCRVEVRELHPYHASIRFPEHDNVVSARLNQYLYGPQDYAVIAVRP